MLNLSLILKLKLNLMLNLNISSSLDRLCIEEPGLQTLDVLLLDKKQVHVSHLFVLIPFNNV